MLANEEEFNDGFLAEMLEFAGLPEENAAQEGADHQIVNQSRGLTDHGDEEQQQVQETAGGSKNDYEYCWTGL